MLLIEQDTSESQTLSPNACGTGASCGVYAKEGWAYRQPDGQKGV